MMTGPDSFLSSPSGCLMYSIYNFQADYNPPCLEKIEGTAWKQTALLLLPFLAFWQLGSFQASKNVLIFCFVYMTHSNQVCKSFTQVLCYFPFQISREFHCKINCSAARLTYAKEYKLHQLAPLFLNDRLRIKEEFLQYDFLECVKHPAIKYFQKRTNLNQFS